ncbi:sphingosine 1-phosphate receptor 3 [Carassius gibelio]|uniref:sphingosine 1-phosphate receptor 3 n=1 Tax=Carassius gibelio TaxID=101364 RepID=UPI00227880B5|nr:sphingosine 1-phosphate receptor 3 [Carassius gibelio]
MINEQVFLHYNYTGKLNNCNDTKGNPLDPKTAVFLVICSLIILENLIVLLAIWQNHKFHKRMFFFIANLALCDLLVGVTYMVNLLMSGKQTLNLTPAKWFVREGIIFVALCASIFSLLAIAIERHLTMIKMRPHDAKQNYRVFLLIGMCWLIAITLGSLPILGWNCLGDLPQCSTIFPLYSKSYVAFCITIYISLLLAISILYVHIYAMVKSSSRKVTSRSNCEHAMSLLRTVSIVLGVFIACWTPIFVLLLVDVACGNKKCPVLLKAHWFVLVAVLNSGMNPFIYTLASREMRRAFFRLVCGCLLGGDATGCKQNMDPSQSKSSSNCPQAAEQENPDANAHNQTNTS